MKKRVKKKAIAKSKAEAGAFRSFVKEFGLVAVAAGFILGAAAKDLTESFINNIIMPFINPLVGGNWQTATLTFYGITLNWGLFLSTTLNFTILALVLFIIVKKVFKYQKKV